jgi:hypothetical protein
MNRLRWVALFGSGILLGCLLTVHPITRGDPPTASLETLATSQEETVNQLKQLNAQFKALAPLLCSGKVRVTVVINADSDRREVDPQD